MPLEQKVANYAFARYVYFRLVGFPPPVACGWAYINGLAYAQRLILTGGRDPQTAVEFFGY